MTLTENMIEYFKNIFYTYGEQKLPFLVNSSLSKKMWLYKYNSLQPFEETPMDEQKEMLLYVCDLFPNKTNEEKVEACKIIYTIGSLL